LPFCEKEGGQYECRQKCSHAGKLYVEVTENSLFRKMIGVFRAENGQ
jgi:hypothetical protein